VAKKNVLVVDDSAASLQLCKGLLSSKYDVRLAKSGKMALGVLARIRPDVILLDIEMPDMNGFEVIEKLNEDPDLMGIPVIFITSHASEKLIYKAMDHGATDYVVKPFEPEVLFTKLGNALK
jgi:putative two-component system response regulator